MDWDALILREGDAIEAWGRLVRTESGSWFEPPIAVPAMWLPPGEIWPPTGFGVRVVGADFGAVERRREGGGSIEGTATLAGRWVAGEFHVEHQTANRLHGPPPDPEWTVPPCRAPVQGWPDGPLPPFDRGDPGADGTIVTITIFRPGATQQVAVVAAGDVEAADSRLRPQLGQHLCVVPSKFSRSELDATRADLERQGRWQVFATGESTDEQGQPLVKVGLTRVIPEIAAWAAQWPDGLVHLEAWLRPSRARPSTS